MRKKLAIVILIVLIATITVWTFTPKPVPVSVATIQQARFVQYVEEDGKTRAKDVYIVTAPVRATLTRIDLDPGDKISKGQVVAKLLPITAELLDKRTELVLRQRLASAEDDAKSAEALEERARVAYQTAKSDFERNQKLSKRGFVSESDLEHQQLEMQLRAKEYDSAKFKTAAAKANVNAAKNAIQRFTTTEEAGVNGTNNILELTSPVTGVVLRVRRESAGSVAADTPLIEISDSTSLEVVTDILSTDAVQIPNKAKVLIKRWGGPAPLLGQVRLIEPNGFTKISALGVEEQRVNVITDILSPRSEWSNLGAGYRVDTEIIIYEDENALLVPVSALFREGEQWAVYVVRSDRAELQQIEIGRRNNQNAMVEKGLSAGDEVVIYPSDQVSDGAKVVRLGH